MNSNFSRREFLRRSATLGAVMAATGPAIRLGRAAANSKVDVAFIGVANRAAENLNELAKLTDAVNVVALCDVDDNYLAQARLRFPRAACCNDFRQLIEQPGIDAVVVSTPDHVHAVAAAAALRTGRHVYCEKPLTRTVAECRKVRSLATEHKRVTQLGTQIHAGTNYRRVVELIQAGAIGPVSEVHVWVGATYGGKKAPLDGGPVPPALHWDLWLGPVPFVRYNPEYAPFAWRNWWAFGGGSLADFGCHFMDLPHWALNLREPSWVEPVDGPPVHPDSPPPWAIVRYRYPAREGGVVAPPVKLTWYHGGKQPPAPWLDDEQREYFKSGVLFVGDRGKLLADYSRRQLLPEARFKDFKAPPPNIPDSIGHHKEWIEAIRNDGTTTCNFDYSGALTEAALLGNVAYRLGRRVNWDAPNLRAVALPEAGKYLQYQYRKGWEL
jgi:predicted dehydrogenase